MAAIRKLARRIDLRPAGELHSLARLAGRFTRYRVSYCVIGGFAAAMYLPHRQPEDVDLIIDPTPRAAERAATAIASLMLDPNAAVAPSAAVANPDLLTAGDQILIETAYGTLHILGTHLPDNCDRSAIVRRRQWFIVGHTPVAVCRIDDLLRIKQRADHKKDAQDVIQLLAAYPQLAGGRLLT